MKRQTTRHRLVYLLLVALAGAAFSQTEKEGLDSLMRQMDDRDNTSAIPQATTRGAAFDQASGSGRNTALEHLWGQVEATGRTRSAGHAHAENRIRTRQTVSGTPVATFMLMPDGLPVPGTARSTSAAGAARAFLESSDVAMAIGAGVRGAAPPASFVQDGEFPEGYTIVPFYQAVEGIPVFASRAVVSLNVDNQVTAFSGNLLDLDAQGGVKGGFTRMMLDEDAARRVAEQSFRQQSQHWYATDAYPVKPFYFSAQVARSDGPPGLCRVWQVLGPESYVLVCANTGDILFEETLIIETAPRKIYDHENSVITSCCDKGFAPLRTEGTSPAGNADADHLYEAIGLTHDFFLSMHGYDGLDGKGMPTVGAVRVCRPGRDCPINNAFWTPVCSEILFGEGMVVTDVVAHEYTHGVTHFMSRLLYAVSETRIDGRRYENVSGAVNESFSDIWGEFVDLTNNPNKQTDQRWIMGDELLSPHNPIRNMRHPPRLGHPDRRYSTHYKEVTEKPTRANRWNGVHNKSTVLSKLCYLLTDGDTFNGRRISGMGIPRVATLFWEIQKQFATASGAGGGTVCSFAEVYEALLRGANALGYSAEEMRNLEQACRAVEIGGLPMPVFNLSSSLSDGKISISWDNPNEDSFRHAVIDHNPYAWPDQPSAGRVIDTANPGQKSSFALDTAKGIELAHITVWAFHGQDEYGVDYYSAPTRCVLDATSGNILHLYEAPVFAAQSLPAPTPEPPPMPTPEPTPAPTPEPTPMPTPEPPPTPPSESDRHAVVVGINLYADASKNLEGCEGDARRFKQLLMEYFGFQASDITLLLSREATAAVIMNALEDRLINNSKPGDQLVFYFSGHGDRIPDLDGDEDDGFDEVLCATDVHPDGDTLRNVIIDDHLHALFSRVPDRYVSVVLDSCHSGTMLRSALGGRIKNYGRRQQAVTRAKALATRSYEPPPSIPTTGAADSMKGVLTDREVLAAATSAERVAMEREVIIDGEKMWAGLFTTFIYETVKATAGQITWQDLHNALNNTDYFPQFQHPHIQANAPMKERFMFGERRSEVPPPTPPPPSSATMQALRVYLADMNEVAPGSRTAGDVEALELLRPIIRDVSCVRLVNSRAEAQVTVFCGVASTAGYTVGVVLPGRYGERLYDAAAIVENELESVVRTLREQFLVSNLRDMRVKRSNMDMRIRLHNHTGLEVREGAHVELRVESDLDGYLMLFSVGAGGELLPYVPSDSFPTCIAIRAGQPYLFPDQGLYIQMDPPLGTEYVKALLWRECPDVQGLHEFFTDRLDVGTPDGVQDAELIIQEILERVAPLQREQYGQQQSPLLADADLTYTSVPR